MNTITITADDAQQICTLFKSIESADAIYKSCQSAQFRAFVKATYTADNVSAAFERLAGQLSNYRADKKRP